MTKTFLRSLGVSLFLAVVLCVGGVLGVWVDVNYDISEVTDAALTGVGPMGFFLIYLACVTAAQIYVASRQPGSALVIRVPGSIHIETLEIRTYPDSQADLEYGGTTAHDSGAIPVAEYAEPTTDPLFPRDDPGAR
jgi:hypothetical protein